VNLLHLFYFSGLVMDPAPLPAAFPGGSVAAVFALWRLFVAWPYISPVGPVARSWGPFPSEKSKI
jgi:hypothetical protein